MREFNIAQSLAFCPLGSKGLILLLVGVAEVNAWSYTSTHPYVLTKHRVIKNVVI
jgi:hypothetical protein